VHVYVDIMLNDQQATHPASLQNAIGSAAAQLGVIEDEEVLQGAVGALPAPAPPPAAAPPLGRFARNVNLARDGIAGGPGVVAALVPLPGPIVIAAGPGVDPDGDLLNVAIINAVAQLQLRNRPGRLGLLVSHNLMATMQLARPTQPGGPPLIREVEARIGKTIVATSALAVPPVVLPALPGIICGVLLLLDPPAADVVHTQLPTVTVIGRAGGLTYLRVEEEDRGSTFGPNGNSDHTILNKAACHDQRSAIAFGAARGSWASARNTMMASGRFCVAVRHGPPAIASRDGPRSASSRRPSRSPTSESGTFRT
jgi:hypothetical protein